MGSQTPAVEDEWWGQGNKVFHPQHYFAHNHVRSRLHQALADLGCTDKSLVLLIGCGSGDDLAHIPSSNILGIDISLTALHILSKFAISAIQADAAHIPLKADSVDFVVVSALLHHLVGQGKLSDYLREFARVTKSGGYVVALEPNLCYPSGILMNIFNALKPGITGLVPYERALAPWQLRNAFRRAGLANIKIVAASYVWNRLPLSICKAIAKHENSLRFFWGLRWLGWFSLTIGQVVDNPWAWEKPSPPPY